MTELLPCPFTGEAPTGPVRQRNYTWTIWGPGYSFNRPTRELVVAAWNTRTPNKEGEQP